MTNFDQSLECHYKGFFALMTFSINFIFSLELYCGSKNISSSLKSTQNQKKKINKQKLHLKLKHVLDKHHISNFSCYTRELFQ